MSKTVLRVWYQIASKHERGLKISVEKMHTGIEYPYACEVKGYNSFVQMAINTLRMRKTAAFLLT